MPKDFPKIIKEFRKQVNDAFLIAFQEHPLIKSSEEIVELGQSCASRDEFAVKVGNLANCIEDFDEGILRSCLKEKDETLRGTINLMKRLLEEQGIQKNATIGNLQTIRKLRNSIQPYHRATGRRFLSLLKEIGLKYPIDWEKLWVKCLDLYIEALSDLESNLVDFHHRANYKNLEIDAEKPLDEDENSVVYWNDVLYKYRILIPTEAENTVFVDYITASLIAYERKLKSINYALKRYVIPFKDRFRQHEEDISFVHKRKYLVNERLKPYRILIPHPKEIGFTDPNEYRIFFNHIWVAFVAQWFGVTPNWIIKQYWESFPNARANTTRKMTF